MSGTVLLLNGDNINSLNKIVSVLKGLEINKQSSFRIKAIILDGSNQEAIIEAIEKLDIPYRKGVEKEYKERVKKVKQIRKKIVQEKKKIKQKVDQKELDKIYEPTLKYPESLMYRPRFIDGNYSDEKLLSIIKFLNPSDIITNSDNNIFSNLHLSKKTTGLDNDVPVMYPTKSIPRSTLEESYRKKEQKIEEVPDHLRKYIQD